MNTIFNNLNSTLKENLLMETAMRIMEVFYDMVNVGAVEFYEDSGIDSMERLQLFCDWAREFEETYYDTDEYNNDFIGLSDSFATQKIKSILGKSKD